MVITTYGDETEGNVAVSACEGDTCDYPFGETMYLFYYSNNAPQEDPEGTYFKIVEETASYVLDVDGVNYWIWNVPQMVLTEPDASTRDYWQTLRNDGEEGLAEQFGEQYTHIIIFR